MQYLKKEVRDEIDFLHADKHESLLQIDNMTLIEIIKHSQSSENTKVTVSLQYIKKNVRELIFSLQMNIELSYWLISTLWASKMSTR